jgi:hypothetical protein
LLSCSFSNALSLLHPVSFSAPAARDKGTSLTAWTTPLEAQAFQRKPWLFHKALILRRIPVLLQLGIATLPATNRKKSHHDT